MNLLLGVFQEFWDGFVMRLQMPAVIVAVILAAVGLGLALVGRKAAEVGRKTKEIEDDDSIMITFKVVGMLLLFVSVAIIVFRGM